MPLVDGLPIGLQIVAWRDQDELLLAATTEIDRVLNPTYS
jgi:Asp-tRNA(Asn)/Glu-tRNA(Gln) amidotransferase A subunit family amidase